MARRSSPALRTIASFRAVMPETHQLVLISGPSFHDEMRRLSDELTRIGLRHAFLPRPHLKHHWNSGWVEEGVKKYAELSVAGDA